MRNGESGAGGRKNGGKSSSWSRDYLLTARVISVLRRVTNKER